ncbi:type II toxin-antitoxin system VapC family toxin [Rhizobium sp. AN5]|uniref:type II toxin-antitoxin system VapC family toxin n=1 Tax=Rhizobium sp. AN5 TaxID=1855304 RepID=UPI00117B83F0|nr:type II toxin-antitoxin system VapC family toxin [Rhizobium sp. AN5]
MAQEKAVSRPQGARDTIVAAIARSNSRIVVTDNERDCYGIEIINPLRGKAR